MNLFGSTPAELFEKLSKIASGRGVKLLLLTGSSNGKADFVGSCLEGQQMAMVKLSAELSSRLASVGVDMIALETGDYLGDMHEEGPVLIDDIEMLFDAGMGVDVLKLLKASARTRLLCVNWPGELDVSSGCLYYARGDVQEKSYPLDSELIVLDESGVIYPQNF